MLEKKFYFTLYKHFLDIKTKFRQMIRATINLRPAKRADFMEISNLLNKMVLRENLAFFIYLKEFNCYNGPFLMHAKFDMDLFKQYLEANLIYVFESYDREILFGDLGLEKEEPQTAIAC